MIFDLILYSLPRSYYSPFVHQQHLQKHHHDVVIISFLSSFDPVCLIFLLIFFRIIRLAVTLVIRERRYNV